MDALSRANGSQPRSHAMYIPTPFAETDLNRLHDFVAAHSFGLLVTEVDGAPFATHMPLVLDRDVGPRGTLTGHVARANPQWRSADGQSALAVFSGPHAYVSPTWYEAEHVVPTWNYVAVHVYGTVRVVDDEPELAGIVAAAVREYEPASPQPWTLDVQSAFTRKMLAQIVGVRIEIERIEGKWKLSQNQPVERRRRVVRALEARGDERARAVADLMRGALPPDE